MECKSLPKGFFASDAIHHVGHCTSKPVDVEEEVWGSSSAFQRSLPINCLDVWATLLTRKLKQKQHGTFPINIYWPVLTAKLEFSVACLECLNWLTEERVRCGNWCSKVSWVLGFLQSTLLNRIQELIGTHWLVSSKLRPATSTFGTRSSLASDNLMFSGASFRS